MKIFKVRKKPPRCFLCSKHANSSMGANCLPTGYLLYYTYTLFIYYRSKHEVCQNKLFNLYPDWQHRLGGCLACRNPGFEPRADRGDLYALCAGVAQGVLPCEGWGGNGQSIGSTVSDAIVCNWKPPIGLLG